MAKAILFDLDGTLTDSGEGIMNCAELALRHFGLPIPDRKTMREFVGPPLDATFIRFGVPADKTDEEEKTSALPFIIGGAALIAVVILVIIVIIWKKRK